MNFFKYETIVKQFPFLRQVFAALADQAHDSARVHDWELMDSSRGETPENCPFWWRIAGIRVRRADSGLMARIGSWSSWGVAGGSTLDYTVFVAVYNEGEEWAVTPLSYAGSWDSAGGHDDKSWDAPTVGDQLSAGPAPTYVVEVSRTDTYNGPTRREVVVHKVHPTFLEQWSRQELHRVADELATELAAAFS